MTTDTQPLSTKLTDLVWKIDEVEVWNVISDLKNKLIKNNNCNINGEKFKKIIELNEQFKNTKPSSKKSIDLNTEKYSVNEFYKKRLDYSTHTKNAKVTSLKTESGKYIVSFSGIKFFKLEDTSRKSYFEYDLPEMEIDIELLQKEFGIKDDTNDHELKIVLLKFLTDKIVPKIDQLYLFINCVSYSPKYLPYYNNLYQNLNDFAKLTFEPESYNYRNVSTVMVDPTKEQELTEQSVSQRETVKAENNISYNGTSGSIEPGPQEDNFSTMYASTKMRIMDQSIHGYTWPFDNPEEGFYFLTMFLMHDLDTYSSKFESIDSKTFYKSFAMSVKDLDISKTGDTNKIENFNKYLDFIIRSQDDAELAYDPVVDLSFTLWEYTISFLDNFLKVLYSAVSSHNKGSLISYFGYNLSMKNYKFDEVIGTKRVTENLARATFASTLDPSIYTSSVTENFFEQKVFYHSCAEVKSLDVVKVLERKSFYFTESKKLIKRIDMNEHMVKNSIISFFSKIDDFAKVSQETDPQELGLSRKPREYGITSDYIRSVLNACMELKTDDVQLDLSKISAFKESIGDKDFSVIDLFSFMSSKPIEFMSMYEKSYNSDPSSKETDIYHLQAKWKYNILKISQFETVIHTRFPAELVETSLKDRDVLISPVYANKEGNIFKSNQFVLEDHSQREIVYSLLIQEFYPVSCMRLDPLMEKAMQIVLSFADSHGRPADANLKIMSLDRTATLMIGMLTQLFHCDHERNEFENNEIKRKLAAFFAQMIMSSLKELHMDVLNYELLAIDKDDDWIAKTDDLFDYKYTIRYMEIVYNANILMTYCIEMLTKDLSPTGYSPYVDLMAWCWASCNLNLSIFLKIDQIIEAINGASDEQSESEDDYYDDEEGPHILKSLILLTSGWRYLLGTILNRKLDDYAIRHELEHLSFDQYMAPINRKFSSGSLSSVSIELLENYMNLIYKNTFIDFNKKDELAMNNSEEEYEIYADINHKVHIHDFFNQNKKETSFFEYLEIIPDDDLDDDVLYVFRDYFDTIETYGPNDQTMLPDPSNKYRHYILDYRLLNMTRVDHMKKYGEYSVPKSKFSAIQEFVESSQDANCSCSVTQTFIKKIEESDRKKRIDITDDELVFVSDTKEFCPLEELSIFSSFVTYPYLTDNKYTIDAYFPMKPILEINLNSCIEKFVNLSNLTNLDKMNLLCELASINYHFNDVFNKGIVFSQEEVLSQIDAESLNMDPNGNMEKNISQLGDIFSLNNGSDKKAFRKSAIVEVKACFNLRGEFLQILFKTDDQIFKLMENDYFFAERLLDEFLMDKFYLCWINCCFSLVKLDSEEEYYKYRYFFFYMFKLLSRSIGSNTDEDSVLNNCYLVKDHPKFDLLSKSYFENTVLPELDHALNYLEVLVDYTARFMKICEEESKEISDEMLKLLDFQIDFYLSQLQGIYLSILSVSESGFDNIKSSEFLYCSPITRCFLLNVADKACPGAFPFSFKDSSVFMTLVQIIRDLSYALERMITLKEMRHDYGGVEIAQLKFSTFFFVQYELNKYLHFDDSKKIVDFSALFNETIEKSNDFKDYELGVYLYSKHLTNQVKNEPCFKDNTYSPMDLVRMYNTFFETSTVYPGMNVNVFVKNGMSFKHSVEHGLDLEDKERMKVTVGSSEDMSAFSDGFIFKSIY